MTVQRFSSILYENAREYNDFHRFCMKKHDSTTIFIDFVRKSTTVQRFSSILHRKARQYNDFHRFCMKKPDSTTVFINFVRKPRQHNGFHCISTTTRLPSQTRCLALPSSRPSAIRPSLPIPNDRKTL